MLRTVSRAADPLCGHRLTTARTELRDRVRNDAGKPIPVPAGKIKTDILDRVAGEQAVLEALLLREGRARQTIKSYASAVKQLQVWWEKPLPEAKREDLLAYLTYWTTPYTNGLVRLRSGLEI